MPETKNTPTPRRPKATVGPFTRPKAARHAGLNLVALGKRRAKNKLAAKSRRINRGK